MTDSGDKAIRTDRDRYEDFLLVEYESIAQAHFNTVSAISTFFRYYLLIVALPIPLFGWFSQSLGTAQATGTANSGLVPTEDLRLAVPIGAILIGLVGLCVLCYIANLRFDAILYARTVNGIRKYFCGRRGISFLEESRIRALPRSTYQPQYVEPWYFGWVILALGLLNAAYWGIGTHVVARAFSWPGPSWAWPTTAAAVFLVLNLLIYWALARYRETRYLRSYIVGVDIDGVLNEHREHFCAMLKALRNKELDPSTIARIPVHECRKLKNPQGGSVSVTEEDEHAVFNHPDYWRSMPPLNGAADRLRRLRNVLGYKIYVFTHRPWPHRTTFPADQAGEYRRLWWTASWLWRRRHVAIEGITRRWLRAHSFVYSKLIVEGGNVHTTDPRLLVRNRFVMSARKRIRVFVEDDLFKAVKLSHICDVVFLLDHPYNQCPDAELPNNVQRVGAWDEIYRFLRENM